MTTEFSRTPSDPPLVPFHLLDRESNRDFILVSSTADLEAAVAAGYRYRGRQGYLYSTCGSEPSCIPTGAEKLWQKCKSSEQDCAVFLESERSAFESAGYTGTPAFATSNVLGYAYPNTDTDADGLVDGMEYVIGTNPSDSDSDDDGSSDSAEYPLAQVPSGDPCVGPSVSCSTVPNVLFKNGFE